MRGTEKQIKWAGDIKRTAYQFVDRAIRVNTDVDGESALLESLTPEELREMHENNFSRWNEICHVKDSKQVEAYKEIRKNLDLFFKKYGEDAEKIIELRHKIEPEALDHMAFVLCNKK